MNFLKKYRHTLVIPAYGILYLLAFQYIEQRSVRPHIIHMKVDDYPYGGGAGLVMQAAPVCAAYDALSESLGKNPRVVYMTPQGYTFNQKMAQDFAKEEELVILCGHYEGIDERALERIVTDYVLSLIHI